MFLQNVWHHSMAYLSNFTLIVNFSGFKQLLCCWTAELCAYFLDKLFSRLLALPNEPLTSGSFGRFRPNLDLILYYTDNSQCSATTLSTQSLPAFNYLDLMSLLYCLNRARISKYGRREPINLPPHQTIHLLLIKINSTSFAGVFFPKHVYIMGELT